MDAATLYPIAKAIHIIAVLAWMAGMLMLPRFYAYQTSGVIGGELDKTMTLAAQRLGRIILTPALLVMWAMGLYIAIVARPEFLTQGWFHIKAALIFLLSGMHGWLIAEGRRLAKGERKHSEKFWRLLNELPFVVAIVAVFLVILKPFA